LSGEQEGKLSHTMGEFFWGGSVSTVTPVDCGSNSYSLMSFLCMESKRRLIPVGVADKPWSNPN
jgi:hypothetical protein